MREQATRFLESTLLRTLPIDTAKIAESLGIKLITYAQLRAVSADFRDDLVSDRGFSVYDKTNGRYYIVYNDSDKVGARFTIAHEIGHILAGHFKNMFITNPYNINRIEYCQNEIYADEFASALVMPYPVVLALETVLKDKKQFVRREFGGIIRNIFRVSEPFSFDEYEEWKSLPMNRHERNIFNLFLPGVKKIYN